jgi:predicted nucleotide-binding protein (sugar kinase/HSP70/actin superfamily)
LANETFEQTVLFEHRFWLQVLGDHARFIFHALSPDEKEEIKQAEPFIKVFDQLLNQARTQLSANQLKNLSLQAQRYAKDIRAFKLKLIEKQLVGDINIGLSPTFMNHMVNEVEEYLRILAFFVTEKIPPPSHPIHHHLVWLIDAAGHAGIVVSSLDAVEKQLKQRGQTFTKHFEQFYLKAVEIAGYLRTGLRQFPALSRFNSDVELELQIFKDFLNELEEMEINDTLLGTLTPLMPDHMAREECYYLIKLAQTSNVSPPPCDPTKPRIT